MLLGDNTGGKVIMLVRPIRFRCARSLDLTLR